MRQRELMATCEQIRFERDYRVEAQCGKPAEYREADLKKRCLCKEHADLQVRVHKRQMVALAGMEVES